jgi:HlyD family secretion protein
MKKINIKKGTLSKVFKRVLIIAVIGLVLFYFIQKGKPAVTEQEVMSSQAVIGNVETVISGNGTLSPANQYEVKSLVKGNVLQAPFEEGDQVKKGSLLYQISTSEIANNIKSSEISVQKAKSAFQEYLRKKDKLEVQSKEDGYIKKIYVKEGEAVQAGKVIADVYNGDTLYLELFFPSEEVKQDWISKKAVISLDATQEQIEGKVTNVSSMTENVIGGIIGKKVTISIENEGGLTAGDMASATVGESASINTGTFRPITETTIVAEIEGIIENLSVTEGEWVTKGTTVLSLASEDLDNQIENAKLSITEAELALETQKAQEELYTIDAPISGRVITKNKKQGDTIDPSTDTQAGPMAIIYDMTYMSFQLNIDELQISNVKEGQNVQITTEAFPDTIFEGTIDRISLKGNTNNGVTSYPVMVKVEEFGGLLPGMNVTGKIIIDQAENVLTIPSSALQEGNIVYLQAENAAPSEDPLIPEGFVAVEVTTGINDGSNVEIKEGLKEGDMIYVPFDDTVTMPDEYYYY